MVDLKKIISKRSELSKKVREIRKESALQFNLVSFILNYQHHQNIIDIIEAIDDPKNCYHYIVMEYVKGGELFGNHFWSMLEQKYGKKEVKGHKMCSKLMIEVVLRPLLGVVKMSKTLR